MALEQKQYKSSIRPAEKIVTSFDWTLDDWNLLYDCHYSKGVESPKFLLNGTGDVVWQMTLFQSLRAVFVSENEKVIEISFSCEPTFLTMVLTISFHNTSMNKLIARTFDGSAPTDANVPLSKNLQKKLSLINASIYEPPITINRTFDGSAPRFVQLPLPEFLKTNSTHMKNDALLLSVQFTIVKSVSISSFPNDSSDDNFGDDFRENLKAIFDSKSFHDVTFVIGNKKLSAHKVMLAAKSDVLKAMFLSGMKEATENVIEIIDIETEIFEEFLNYIYAGKVSNLGTIVDDMIFVADKYQIEDLKSMCANYIAAYLDTENVVKYLLIAYKLNCDTLKNKALELIKRNMQILTNESHYKLLGEYPLLIREIFG